MSFSKPNSFDLFASCILHSIGRLSLGPFRIHFGSTINYLPGPQQCLSLYLCWWLIAVGLTISGQLPSCAADDPISKSVMPKQTVDFESQVMPLFSKHGCNAAECHGSATGRGDFKLSLFGGDPDRDYQAIVHHLQGRRVNFEQPSKSLLLTKPLEMLAHGGGEVFAEGSVAAARIRDWIKSGARREAQVRITGIAVETPSWI